MVLLSFHLSCFADEWQAVFWVETKGLTLEEVDAIFEGSKHSSVPDVERVRKGTEQIDMNPYGGVDHKDVDGKMGGGPAVQEI